MFLKDIKYAKNNIGKVKLHLHSKLFRINIILIFIATNILVIGQDFVSPDFRVNNNNGNARQLHPRVTTTHNNNFFISWSDDRYGPYQLFGQQFNGSNPNKENVNITGVYPYIHHSRPEISMLSDNKYVAVWEYNHIYIQLLDSTFMPISDIIKVDDIGSDGYVREKYPSIAASKDKIVVVWQSNRNSTEEIYAQLFSHSGLSLGQNLLISQTNANSNSFSVSFVTDSTFMVVWDDDNNIKAQIFSDEGISINDSFIISSYNGNDNQHTPSITSDIQGNIFVVWVKYQYQAANIYLQKLSSDGQKIGDIVKLMNPDSKAAVYLPRISGNSLGNFVVTWSTYDDDYLNSMILAQQISKDGSLVGNTILVDDESGNVEQLVSDVAVSESNDFIVVWRDKREGNYDIYAQYFDSNGNPSGSNFRVNTDEGNVLQEKSKIAVDKNGDFIVVWENQNRIAFQRYLSDGTPAGENSEVNSDPSTSYPNSQYEPSIAIDENGDFVLVWMERIFSDSYLFYQMFFADGTPKDTVVQVNDNLTYNPYKPSVDCDNEGNFVVTWYIPYTGNQNVYYQYFSADGLAVGTNKIVSEINDVAVGSSLAMADDGNFIITWQVIKNDTSSIYAQRFQKGGEKIGSIFKVNINTEYSLNLQPEIVIDSNNNFVVCWYTFNEDFRNILYQRFDFNCNPLAYGEIKNINSESSIKHKISSDQTGNFIIVWQEATTDDSDIYVQKFFNDGTLLENIYSPTNSLNSVQEWPDIKLNNGLVYTTWTDNRSPTTGIDVWVNIHKWDAANSKKEENDSKYQFFIHQNYPNPFNPSTVIDYSIAQSGFVDLKIFDVLGKEVATIVSKEHSSGNYKVEFNASNLTSGIYFYRLQSGGFVETKKMVLLR